MKGISVVLAVGTLLLGGCSSFGMEELKVDPPNTTTTLHYTMIDNVAVGTVLPPPQRGQYDTRLYNDPDLPFVHDLKEYNKYLTSEIERIEDLQHQRRQWEPRSCKPFELPPREPLPKFKPSNIRNKDVILEEGLIYIKTIKAIHESWAAAVDREMKDYSERCKL